MQNEYRQAIEQYRQKVVTLARYSLRSAADAEDIAQEVFVKLWHHWPSVDADRRLAWLMRVTHNAVIDFTRRRKTKHGVFDEAAEVEEQAGDDDQHGAAEIAAILRLLSAS